MRNLCEPVWTPENANADVIAPHQHGDVRVALLHFFFFYLYYYYCIIFVVLNTAPW